jgi:hypothetical protein
LKSKNTEAVCAFSPMGGEGGGGGVRINMQYTASEESACSEVATSRMLLYSITQSSVGRHISVLKYIPVHKFHAETIVCTLYIVQCTELSETQANSTGWIVL